ncbi:glycosyl transferase family 1 [Novimethylophilus kurashikiensis]|uniref:Glycosyl transferase family 1 n=1 Tax=Novimethylophilus kurashikiensis TaxID=1825523 RepID=A0A2R5F5Q2_9PROT|nr:glycosyltransferase [Novimethylophilus kurashikiensis]GBG13239.1 glycosyl transferase family 1 [Novimethylophilus kurashikiensis]
MKILFVSDVYFPRINGVSTSIQTFRHELRERGHVVHLIAPDYYMPSDDESDILRVPSRSLPMDPEDRLMKYSWVIKHLPRLRAENYDLVHVQTPFAAHYLGLKLGRTLGIPCVETYHTFFEEYLYHYIPFLPKSVLRFAARAFSRHQGNALDGMVVPSRPMLDVLRKYGVNANAEIIPTGLRPESFNLGDGPAFRKRYGISQERPVMLFLGRVAHEKNIGFLLQVVQAVKARIPDVLLLIAGEGPAREGLERETEALGLSGNVQFIGYLDRHTELNDCYRAADVFVFSSRTETQGLVLLEAMAQGVPVVSTAEMGTKDVLKDGYGVWIAEEQVNDFSEKVVRLLEDDAARGALSLAAGHYARHWSAGSMAEKMLDFYQALQMQSMVASYQPG